MLAQVAQKEQPMGAVILDDVLSDELFFKAERAYSLVGVGTDSPYLCIQGEERTPVTPLQSEYIAKMWQDDGNVEVEPVGKTSLYVSNRFVETPPTDGRQTLEYRLKTGNRKRGQSSSPFTKYFGATGPMGRY